ncbi:MAG: hypothetical protein WB422_08105, partial [Pseudolabrys sp.]
FGGMPPTLVNSRSRTSSEQIQFDAVCPVNAGGQKWLILIISGSRLSIVIAISLFATVTASAFGERAYII